MYVTATAGFAHYCSSFKRAKLSGVNCCENPKHQPLQEHVHKHRTHVSPGVIVFAVPLHPMQPECMQEGGQTLHIISG